MVDTPLHHTCLVSFCSLQEHLVVSPVLNQPRPPLSTTSAVTNLPLVIDYLLSLLPHYFLCRYFPFGIVFLVAGKILEMDDPSAMGKKLGFYAITVVMGLVLHGLFILPAMYFFITKKSPIVYIRGILQALLISLATSSR